jgi:hypothetical protein
MGSVSISILISIIGGDGFAPVCSPIEIDMIDVGSSIDNIDINPLTRIRGIQVLVEITEG